MTVTKAVQQPNQTYAAAWQMGGSWLLMVFTLLPSAWADQAWTVVHDEDPRGSMEIRLHGKPFATFMYRDQEIRRPYFANIYSPTGIKVTRNHPPQRGDAQDHAKLHPGIWLAFGDIAGNDYWRLESAVEHVRFVQSPTVDRDRLGFAVESRYLQKDSQQEVCREVCRYELRALDNGVLWLWDSTFHSSDEDFSFGDQEEMGLGVRLATRLAVNAQQGGRILNSNGQRNEKEVWGQQANWCDYSGTLDGSFVGIMIMPHPGNFRRCWYHARDYGFLAANPFGRRAFTNQDASKIVVRRGQSFPLRFGIYVHWHDAAEQFEPTVIYDRYLKAVGEHR